MSMPAEVLCFRRELMGYNKDLLKSWLDEDEDYLEDYSEPLFSKNRKEEIKYIEKALCCIKKALQIEPQNEEYLNILKFYYQKRNEIYCFRSGV